MRTLKSGATWFVLTLAVILVLFAKAWFQHSKSRSRSAPRQGTDSSTSPQPQDSTQNRTGTSAVPQDGFFLGKGDARVFVKYGTADPVLQSFIQSVMQDNSDPKSRGREVYLKLCGICHQPDGEGKDGLAPPLDGSEWALTSDGERAVRIVLNGLMGPVRVRDKSWNLAMPPWRDTLNDDQIALVLTYVRTQLGGNHATPITPEFVAAARKDAHPSPQNAEQLLRMTSK